MKKARKWSRLIVLILAFACVAGLFVPKAYAWKTKTHALSANLLLADAADGYLTVDGTNYKIPQEFMDALKAYPNAFRAGTLGPDFYPDMLTGQSYIHPYDKDAGVGVGDWLMELVKGVNSLPYNSAERKEALAFTLGMAVHFAGDQFGHDFINAFAGGAYPAYKEVVKDKNKLNYIIRHMAEESYMDGLIGSRIGSTDVKAPVNFIINTWIYEGTANAGPAKIYSNYKAGMEYQYKYLVELRQKLYNYAEKRRYEIWPPIPQIVQYIDRWIEDLDTATYQLIKTFDEIAHDFTTGANGKSDISIVTDRLNQWLKDYGKYASPTPDFLKQIADAFNKSTEWVLKELGLQEFTEAWKEFQNKLVSSMVLWGLSQAGIDISEYTDLLSDPSKALDAEDYKEYLTYMNAFKKDPESFDAFYNTLLLGKLILMGPDNLNDFFHKYGAASTYSTTTGSLMMDEFYIYIHTKKNGLFDTYGTNDNVICDVYDGNTLITSKLLDTSGNDDFESDDEDEFYVSLPKKISPANLKVALRIEQHLTVQASPDDWTPNLIKITCRCLGVDVLPTQTVLNGAYKFDIHGKQKFLNFSVSANSLSYTTALNPRIISYMKSNDNSTQWVNQYNLLWSNSAARQNVLYEVFHGFKPSIELTADKTVFTKGTKATLTANFTSHWNGITKERRDAEFIIEDFGETRQQACNGTVNIMDVSGQTPKKVLTGTVSNGVMTVDMSSLAPGTYKLRADFGGDDYNGSGQSNVLEVTVNWSCNVTFQVVNGSWDSGSRQDITIPVSGTGSELYLTADQIPAVGNNPVDNTYKAGSWDPMLDTETPITGNTTFVYTYEKKKPISQTVTFLVENGSWDDGTTDKKTVILSGLEGDVLKLSADQIPAVGKNPADYTYKPGSWDTVPNTEAAITGNPTYTYTFEKKKDITQTVTFLVVNGSWDDGSTDKKTVTLPGLEGDMLKLSADQIPAVGKNPADYTFKPGSWDTVPDTETVITGNPTYTYTFEKKKEITQTVTFEVVNGSWDDGSTEKKTVTLNGWEGDVLKLSEDQIPAAGKNPADYTFKPGGWDTVPDTETEIKGNPTYTYTYEKKNEIIQTVTFLVVNGSWDDGSTDKKTVTLSGWEGDVLKLSEDQIPAAGKMPADDSFKEGSWDTVPDTETEITGDPTYTYTYAMKDRYTVKFETNGGSSIPDATVISGKTVAKPDDPEKKAYAFTGWFSDEDCKTPYDFSAQVLSNLVLYAAWEPVSYTASSDAKYTQGAKEDAVITVHRSHADETCFAHFTGVMIDGKMLKNGKDYTAAQGSTVVTLKASMMKKLSEGSHSVTILFDDGQADTKLTVNASQFAPDTGDRSNLGLWSAFFIAGLSGTVAVMAYDRKRAAAKK